MKFGSFVPGSSTVPWFRHSQGSHNLTGTWGGPKSPESPRPIVKKKASDPQPHPMHNAGALPGEVSSFLGHTMEIMTAGNLKLWGRVPKGWGPVISLFSATNKMVLCNMWLLGLALPALFPEATLLSCLQKGSSILQREHAHRSSQGWSACALLRLVGWPHDLSVQEHLSPRYSEQVGCGGGGGVSCHCECLPHPGPSLKPRALRNWLQYPALTMVTCSFQEF